MRALLHILAIFCHLQLDLDLSVMVTMNSANNADTSRITYMKRKYVYFNSNPGAAN
jgi:hypothetical protein